jgi:glycosyltransferase involved in cell wall biosynthesis
MSRIRNRRAAAGPDPRGGRDGDAVQSGDRRSIGEARRRRFDVAFYVPWVGPLLIASVDSAPPGGAETQIALLSRALAARGAKVCLIVFELAGVSLPASFGGVAVAVRPPYRTRQRLGKIRETLSLARAILSVDTSVVVARGATPDVGLVAVITKLLGRRFVYSSANVSDFTFSGLSEKRLNKALFRLAVRLADQIIVQTKEQVRLCEETFGKRGILIRSVAEPAEPRDHTPEAFLWIGRVVWYKRPLAFVELARSLPEAEFWMIGVPAMHDERERELLQTLEAEAAKLPNLTLIPPKSREELMELVNRAVAIVNTADFEGMPNIFLEGWARGVPALALTHDPDGVIETFGLGAVAHGSIPRLTETAAAFWQQRRDQAVVAGRSRQYVAEFHSPERVSARWNEALGIDSDADAT